MRRIAASIIVYGLVIVASIATAESGKAAVTPGVFHIDRLPKGKNVTLGRPATTVVPLDQRIQLTATDIPQSISFRAVNTENGAAQTIKISIFDGEAERVKYVDVKPGTPFLYTFKELGAITVIPKGTGPVAHGLSLQVESDKPLEIAH